jgi:uncharacterized membrane protein
MTPSAFFKLYAVALPVFLLIDLIWLGIIARPFYQKHMGHLMRPDVNWAAALVFYLVFVAGIVVFVVWPAIERESLTHALILGTLFGLVTYAAYDLTNLATLNTFPITVAVVDLIWGMVLCSTVGTVTYLVSTRITSLLPETGV